MILFLADNHFNARPGFHLYEKLKDDFEISFYEDDLSPLKSSICNYELLILNLIPGTPGSDTPDATMENNVKAYVDSGKPLLLLHGASAMFPHLEWWRELVGLRWVRENDKWGKEPSFHPNDPFKVERTKNIHLLSEKLLDFEADDELYVNMERTCPIFPLMESKWDGKSWTQCYVGATPAQGRLGAFIPGHRQDIVESKEVLHNISTMISWCMGNE